LNAELLDPLHISPYHIQLYIILYTIVPTTTDLAGLSAQGTPCV